MAYIFKKFHEFLKAHPDSSDLEQLLERRRLRQEWLDLGPVAQEAFAKGRQIDLIDWEPLEMEVPQEVQSDFEVPSWDPGSETWGVSTAALQALQEYCSAGCTDGIAAKMQRLRWDARDRLVVPDARLIDEAEVFAHRFACGQLHPGLCRTKHQPVYAQCLQLAGVLERFFSKDELHGFFQIFAADVAEHRRKHSKIHTQSDNI